MTRLRFGPGLLATAAFIGPGTLVTASRAGAGYGVTLLWAVLFSVAATGILQDMAAGRPAWASPAGAGSRKPSVTASPTGGSGVGALGLITGTILVGTAAFQTGNLIGAALGLNLLLGLPAAALALGVGGLAAGVLMTRDLSDDTEHAGRTGRTDGPRVLRGCGAHRPGPRRPDCRNPDSPPPSRLAADRLLALIGTTFVSYNLFLHANTVLERWPDAGRNDENLRESRRDTVFAVALGGLITAAVIVASAPLLGQGADAANAAAVADQLTPLLGRAAPVFFGLGLFAAGLTSAITAPLAAAYAASGALGWRPDLRSGRFRLLWGLVLATGVVCAPSRSAARPIRSSCWRRRATASCSPLTLILLLIVVNKTRIMGPHRNSRLANLLRAIVVLVISGLSLMQLARVLGLVG